jgi:hypothetical protein
LAATVFYTSFHTLYLHFALPFCPPCRQHYSSCPLTCRQHYSSCCVPTCRKHYSSCRVPPVGNIIAHVPSLVGNIIAHVVSPLVGNIIAHVVSPLVDNIRVHVVPPIAGNIISSCRVPTCRQH